jgi:hypothetical protein
LTNALCLTWAGVLALIVAGVFADPKPLILASLIFPIYYFVVSWWITLQRWAGNRRQSARAEHRLPSLATETPIED